MPEISQLLGQVQWEIIAAATVAIGLLQLIAAIIHPLVFRLITFFATAAIVAIGLRDGVSADNPEAFHSQALEMGLVIVSVLIVAFIIAKLFRAMARASYAV